MRDPFTGEFIENITCTKCRRRHPATWSCAQSAGVAEAQRVEREARAPDQGQVIDLDDVSMETLREAARQSTWMPAEYMANDWLSDLCEWLRDGPLVALPPAAADVFTERQRQISAEDWTHEHDDDHPNGEIAAFAAVYAMPPAAREWPAADTGYGDTLGVALCPEDWTPKFGDRRRELVKAGALILAEIERLDRASDKASRHAAAEAWLK